MSEEDKRIIEVNGVKLEVDLRNARVVEQYRIGDPVKVVSKRYENDYVVSPGVIIDIVEDAHGAGIVQIMTLKESYNDADIEIVYFGEKTNSIVIAPFNKYEMKWSDVQVNDKFDRMIEKKQEEIRVLQSKQKAYNDVIVKAIS